MVWKDTNHEELKRNKQKQVFILSHTVVLSITSSFVSPSPIPEFSNTPQENHMAEDKVRASSSSSSLFTLNLPNGLEEGDHRGCRT